MIVSILIFIITILSILQSDKRRMTALVYSLLVLIHEIFFQGLNGYWYFITAALMGVSIMVIIANLQYTTKLTENLMKISFCFIIVNFIGWLMWMTYIDLLLYQYVSILLYITAIVSLLNWDGVEDGNYKVDWWINNFHWHNYSSNYNSIKLSRKD